MLGKRFYISCVVFGILAAVIFTNSLKMVEKVHNDSQNRVKRDHFADGFVVGAVVTGPLFFIGGLIGGLLCVIFCSDPPPPPNTPPSISSCPSNLGDVFAREMNNFAVVHWSRPVAKDKEDGNIILKRKPKELPKGSKFTSGKHTILYTARDRKGTSARPCSFSFNVVVVHCSPLFVENAVISPAVREIIFGQTLNITCKPGHRISPKMTEMSTKVKCIRDGKKHRGIFDVPIPTCSAINCLSDSNKLKPRNGQAKCTDPKQRYGSNCYTDCFDGYRQSNSSFTVCTDLKKWSIALPDCLDAEPPVISNCPKSIRTFADRKSNSTSVTWTEPTVTDNSGTADLQRVGPASGSVFQVSESGIPVKYTAIDKQGNKAKECEFYIFVEEFKCSPPDHHTDRYMSVLCPNGYSYGSMCILDCPGNFPLIGATNITCERNGSTGYWTWENGTKSYCKVNPCNPLPAPDNGAMACDTWLFGRQCQMQCRDPYDIPASAVDTNAFTGIFTCSDSRGDWFPTSIVPDCTEKKTPHQIRTLGKFFYFTGNCNNQTVQENIKRNFISQMKILENQGFNGICSDENECNIGNVTVHCGETTQRRRRSASSTEKDRLVLEFTLQTEWINANNASTMDTFKTIENMQKDINKKIQAKLELGDFNVEGASVENGSFTAGPSTPDCPPGFVLKKSSLSCVLCPKGTYLDEALGDCINCPIGTYKSNNTEFICTSCPKGMSTLHEGSTNYTDCLSSCVPGFFSPTGLEPCAACSHGTFSDGFGESNCTVCPTGTTTLFEGENNITNCQVFDVELKPTPLGKTEMDYSNMTIFTWVYVNNEDNSSLQLLQFSSYLSLSLRPHLIIHINGSDINTNATIGKNVWQHLSILVDVNRHLLQLYVNGVLKFERLLYPSAFTIPAFTPMSIPESMKDTDNHVTISGFGAVGRVLQEEDIKYLSTKCFNQNIRNMFLSMTTFLHNGVLENVIIDIPSQCDDVNHCEPNPCNGHTCIDSVGGYECRCGRGYYGAKCQNAPDLCLGRPCKNGATCVNNGTEFSCTCPEGFNGGLCDHEIVNGGWSSWNEWAACTVTCGGGLRYRNRACDNPIPENGGLYCLGLANDSQSCNTESCPVCPSLRLARGNVLNCDNSSKLINCTLSCELGMTFTGDEQPLPYYMCGEETAYSWNGVPPACAKIQIPQKVQTTNVLSYPGVTCDKKEEIINQLKNKLAHVRCMLNGTCNGDVSASECIGSKPLQVNLVLSKEMEGDPNAKLFIVKNNLTGVNSKLVDFAESISDIERSISQINESKDQFSVEVDGDILIPNDLQVEATVQCLSGQVRDGAFCTNCPEGTREENSNCVSCEIGTYQDEAARTSCKLCPEKTTTQFIGSQFPDDCIAMDNKNVTGGRNEEKSTIETPTIKQAKSQTIDMTTLISISVAVTFVIIFIGVVLFCVIRRNTKTFKLRRQVTAIARQREQSNRTVQEGNQQEDQL